jgi:hypothetical protein
MCDASSGAVAPRRGPTVFLVWMPEILWSLRLISGTHSRGRTHHRGQPPAAQLSRPGAELAALVLSVFHGDPLRTLHGSPSCPWRSKLMFTYGKRGVALDMPRVALSH